MINRASAQWIVLFGIALIGLWQFTQLQGTPVWADEALYAWNAESIAHNPAFLFSGQAWANHPPLQPFLASLLIPWTNGINAVRIISILFGIGILFLVFRISRRVGDPLLGVMAVLLVATNPAFLLSSTHGLLENGFVFGFLLVLVSLEPYYERKKILPLIAALVVVALMKKMGVIALIWVLCGIIGIRIWRNNHHRKHLLRLTHPLSVCIVALTTGIVGWYGVRAIIPGHFSLQLVLSHIRDNMRMLVGQLFPLFIPFGLGIIAFVRNPTWQRSMLLGWVLLWVPLLVFGDIEYRFWYPLIIPISIISAYGIQAIGKLFSPHEGIIQMGVAGILVGLLLASTLQSIDQRGEIGYNQVGEWMKANAPSGIIYDETRMELRYYSGIELAEWNGRIRSFPVREIESSQRPIYAIVSPFNNRLVPAANTDELTEQGFELIHQVEQPWGQETVVFDIYRLS